MAFTSYQLAYFQSSFNLSTLTNNLAPTVTQKTRHHFATRSKANNKVLQIRPRAAKTLWSSDFVDPLVKNISMNGKDKLKEIEVKVTATINDYENGVISTLELLEFIDNIERLGLGYRFHYIISEVLNKIAALNKNHLGFKQEEEEDEENNLHVLSLKFRILRQHGYSASQEDFLRTFKERHGGFKTCLQLDVASLLSIYEASYLFFEGEIDLHEANLFATENLLKLNGHENEVTKDYINHALDIPLYRRMPRLEARWYIDAYGKRKDANKLLLELAILDFNMVQSIHKRDLQEVSEWWENIGLQRKLSFISDRVVECFFWSVGIVFEPQYYSCRVGLTKVCVLITTLDDIYDGYGSLDELKAFTDAVKRWDIKAMKYMPEYLQLGFLALYNTINDMGYESLISQGKYIIPIHAKVWGELLESFLVEATWTQSQYIPKLEDYLDNAWRSASGMVILTHGYFLMNQDAKDDGIESLEKYHELFKWSSMLFRLYNDLAASSDEIDRERSANAISCYMHQHGVCEEVAREYMKTLIDKAWMKMIEARIASSEDLLDRLVDIAINLARVANCTYQYGDGIKAPEARTKDRISSIIIEPITIWEN